MLRCLVGGSPARRRSRPM